MSSTGTCGRGSNRFTCTPRGFVYLRWRKAEVLRWEQIKTVWYETGDPDSNVWDTLRIRKTDGTDLKLRVVNVLRDSSEIYGTIEREFVRIRLPGMIEQYEAGHSIAFGDLSVNKLGLTRQGEILPWSQVQSIDVGDQRVKIKKEGKKGGIGSPTVFPIKACCGNW